MKEVRTIEIPESVSDYIESLQYECNARSDLISFMVRNGLQDEEGFKKYHAEFVDFHAQLELAKQNMEDTYLRPECSGSFMWNLDFKTHEVTVVES
jgi:metal-responsive CopG/Arc/MetJ family transcriptional regulator